MPVAMGAMAIASIGATVAGTMIQSNAARQAGAAQAAMNKYQADVAHQQALLAQRTAEQNTRLTQISSSEDTAQLQRKYATLRGAQVAARAASGIGGGSVTEGDIATDTFRNQTLDEMAIRYKADVKSWALKEGGTLEAWGQETQANQYRMAGSAAERAAKIQSRATLFAGASSVANTGMTYGYYSGWGK